MQWCRKLGALIGATALLVAGCDQAVVPPSDPALSFLIVSGNQQIGAAGTQLPQPLVVKVLKPDGGPQKSQVLNFHVTTGGGSVFGGTELTNNEGIAQELWTVGTKAGEPQRIEVRAVDPQTGQAQVFATFTATVVAGPPVRMRIEAGASQVAPPGSAVRVLPAVKLDDQYQNPTPNLTVTFAVTGGGGSITGAVATTNPQGVATLGSWTLGTTIGPNTLSATASGSGIAGNPATFSAFASCDCWNTRAAAPYVTYGATVTGLNGKLYVVGGYTYGAVLSAVQVYDPATDTWGFKTAMNTPRLNAAAAVINGILYVVGGDDLNATLGTLEAYDPATDTWTTKTPMPNPRTQLGVAVVNGILYAIGGTTYSSNQEATVQAYDPATDSWTTKAPLTTARRGPGVAAIDGIIYAVGGANYSSYPYYLATTEAYDPSTNRWTPRASMTQPRTTFGLAESSGMLYAIGGYADVQLQSVEQYDPASDTWTLKSPMPTARYTFDVGVVDGFIYAVSGYNYYYGFLRNNEVYQP